MIEQIDSNNILLQASTNYSGLHKDRPDPTIPGLWYYETDTTKLFYSSGKDWLGPVIMPKEKPLPTTPVGIPNPKDRRLGRVFVPPVTNIATVTSKQQQRKLRKARTPTAGILTAYALIQEQKAQNKNGGAYPMLGIWQTRALNTTIYDTADITDLKQHQITLDPGTYMVRASAAAYRMGNTQLRLQNVDVNQTLITGDSAFVSATASAAIVCTLTGAFTIVIPTTIELQHQGSVVTNNTGMGMAANFGTEVYATIEFWRE